MEQQGSPRPKQVSWSRRSSEMMEDGSEKDAPATPFTITSIQQCVDAQTSAQAADQIRASLNRSHSLTPSKVTARIEATELPASLDNLPKQHIQKLKQIQFEHLREERKKKALDLIASIENAEHIHLD